MLTQESHIATQEIKKVKAKLKGNLAVTEARQGVWDKIIQGLDKF